MPAGIGMSSDQRLMSEFIKMYKNMTFLYDKSHPNYNDRPLRMKGYKKLLEKYQEMDGDATIAIVRAKVDTMRNSYIRELKKIRASKKRHADPSYWYTPHLWYFHLLDFLEDHVLKTKTSKVEDDYLSTSKLNADTNTDNSVDYLSLDDEGSHSNTYHHMTVEYLQEHDEDNIDSSSEVPTKIRRMKTEYVDTSEMVSGLTAKDSDWEVIGKAIGIQLRDIEPHQSAVAQRLIAEALFNAKLGKLKENSYIYL